MQPRLKTKAKRHQKKSVASSQDILGALPDEVLQHVLSFLPSDDAVRMCVLSRRWRHLWRSTPAVLIKDTERKWDSAEDMNDFVNHLLLLRNRVPLDTCEINSYPEYGGELRDKPFRYIELWIRYALACKARMLRVLIFTESDQLELQNTPLISQHLTVLELDSVELDNRSLDFSSCPALKALKMANCIITAHEISSQSIWHLIATDNTFELCSRTRISIPSLVSLHLDGFEGRTPVLRSMPLLVTAYVQLDMHCYDWCDNGSTGDCGNDWCEGCHGSPDSSNMCVLLRGVSNATNLELLANPQVFIFKRDLALCPTFSKLKTLLLNGWSVALDLSSVICLLQHSPVLEKLIFQLCEVPEHQVEMEGSQNPAEQQYGFRHLKVVEVQCQEADERVQKFLKSLSFYGIPADVMKIKKPSGSSFSANSRSLLDLEKGPTKLPAEAALSALAVEDSLHGEISIQRIGTNT